MVIMALIATLPFYFAARFVYQCNLHNCLLISVLGFRWMLLRRISMLQALCSGLWHKKWYSVMRKKCKHVGKPNSLCFLIPDGRSASYKCLGFIHRLLPWVLELQLYCHTYTLLIIIAWLCLFNIPYVSRLVHKCYWQFILGSPVTISQVVINKGRSKHQ